MKSTITIELVLFLFLTIVTLAIVITLGLRWFIGYTQGACMGNAYTALGSFVQSFRNTRTGEQIVPLGDCIIEVKFVNDIKELPGDLKCQKGARSYIGIVQTKSSLKVWKKSVCIPVYKSLSIQSDCETLEGPDKGEVNYYCLKYEPSSAYISCKGPFKDEDECRAWFAHGS